MAVNLGSMPIGLKMITTRREFKRKILMGMYRELKKKLTSTAFKNSISRGVKPILANALKAQPEYQDMVAQVGKLRAELGVVDSKSAMDSLVRDWVRSTHVSVSRPRIVGDRILGTIISVKAIQADYADVLNKAYASYTTERGETIPWLDWLLTQGSRILITSHKVWTPPVPTARSRTGNTIMIKSGGAGWGVPPEYAGTPDNNYATRAVVTAMPEIERLIEAETKRRFT